MLARVVLCELMYLVDRGGGILLLVYPALSPCLRCSTVPLGNCIFCVNSRRLGDPRPYTGGRIRGHGIPHCLLKNRCVVHVSVLCTLVTMVMGRLQYFLNDGVLFARTLLTLKDLCPLNGVEVPLLKFHPLMGLPGYGRVASCDGV